MNRVRTATLTYTLPEWIVSAATGTRAAVCQLSFAPSTGKNGGSGMPRYELSAQACGSYFARMSWNLSFASASVQSFTPTFPSSAHMCSNCPPASRSSHALGWNGARPKTCARSTSACRDIAKVSCACRALASCTLQISRAQVSKIATSAESQLWLSCCER